MGLVRIFRYLPEVDAFDATPEYAQLATTLGIAEWNPVVWIGRLFLMDNDFGEHWFDNWEAREVRRALAESHGLDADTLLIIDPDRFRDGRDGPCHTAEFRARFWRDVLKSLALSSELLFDKARDTNAKLRELIDAGHTALASEFVHDLEERIAAWNAANCVERG
jgi:hypothetical protein